MESLEEEIARKQAEADKLGDELFCAKYENRWRARNEKAINAAIMEKLAEDQTVAKLIAQYRDDVCSSLYRDSEAHEKMQRDLAARQSKRQEKRAAGESAASDANSATASGEDAGELVDDTDASIGQPEDAVPIEDADSAVYM